MTMGSGNEIAARQRPHCLPVDLQAEWELVIRGQHNVLLVGTPSATHETLVALTPHLREPLQAYRPTEGVAVPQPPRGTLVLLEVAKLDPKQQTQLLRWLDQFNDRVLHVVSTTSEPFFSLVQTGEFLADLYYRLNVVRIDLIGACERTP